jgi:hypothetical protein
MQSTVSNYFKYFEQLTASTLEDIDTKIGGEGIIVEIDEAKFGKRKFHRGHRVDGVWVVGGVERTPQRKCFLLTTQTRDEWTMSQIILEHVLPGSVIHTDCWRAYNFLDNLPQYSHYTVNHSQNFADPETGVHTNTIEGTWSAIKRQIPARKRTENEMGGPILELIWRRKNKDNLWESLLEALKQTHYQ